jgi:large subunit ribosomal protein L19
MTTDIFKEKNKNFISKDLLKVVENKYRSNKFETNLKVGDIIKIFYKINEGDKERLQNYEGLIISTQNRGLGKSIIIRRKVQGIGIEQVFLLHSPKIENIIKKQSTKVRRSKLYYIRLLVGKKAKIKSL